MMSDAVREIALTGDCLGQRIEVRTLVFPEGIVVSVYGGEAPNIGAVSVAGPDGGVTTTQFPGHRDGAVSGKWARTLADRGWLPAVVQAGIHCDALSPEGIGDVLATTDRLLERLLAALSGKAAEVRTLSLPEIRDVYASRMVEDFPRDELRPMFMIEAALERGEYACYGFADRDGLLAYAFFVLNGEMALVDYLAVRKDRRDGGVGGRFIRALVEGPLRAYRCVLLEVDDPDLAPDAGELETRNRRLRFYLRNGLLETGVKAEVFGVGFRILALPVGETPSPDQTRSAYARLYRAILPKRLYDTKVKIQ